MTPESSATAIEDAAIAWLAERDDGFSDERRRDFAAWLKADPRHAAAVARMEQTLGLLNELPEFRREINAEFARTPVAPATEPAAIRRRLGAWGWLAAGGMAAALIFAFLTERGTPAFSAEIVYATPQAAYERASLNDGSTVELNAGSTVRVQFSPGERHVNLDAGEAHFAVARDAARPFVVSAGDVVVRAVGTAFNVRRGTDGMVEVIVTEGSVQVSHDRPLTEAPDRHLVTAGERLVFPARASTPVVERMAPAQMVSALSWQGRLVEFADAPLTEIVERFNARNRVQLVLVDADLGHRRIGGTFALDEAEAFVRLLERNGAVIAERRGEFEILLRPGP